MSQNYIHIRGARQHNLKNIDVSIPREKLVVITGVSGSGKSTLAFDTIYAEGQRRYVESLSAYARQFLGRMDKPEVDYIEGLSPAIAIDQKGVSHNPRSTVGTITEVYDYLRLLFARIGHPHCPKCKRPITQQTVQQIVDALLKLPKNSRIMILAPKIRRRKGEHKNILEEAVQSGFIRIRVDGEIYLLDDTGGLQLDKHKWHYIEIVVDRLVVEQEMDISRVANSVETALREGDGVVQVLQDNGDNLVFSEHFACVHCGISLPEIEPRTFSFNSPHGACQACTGLGFKLDLDPDLIIPNRDLSLSEGAIMPWMRAGSSSPWYLSLLESAAKAYKFSTKVPVAELSEKTIDLLLYGNGNKKMVMRHKTRQGRIYNWETSFEGVIPNLERRHKGTASDHIRSEIERYMAARPCTSCQGQRLRPEALAVTVSNKGIMDVCAQTIEKTLKWVSRIANDHSRTKNIQVLSQREKTIGNQILKEIEARLSFLHNIGLGYLTVDRMSQTLSGGESQRIRLATQIGSGLTGVLYVCDEPTVGLHPADDARLINTLKELQALGNTILVVEHDEALMRAADYIVDLGPGAGEKGGVIVASGTIQDIMESPESITGQYLSGRKTIPVPTRRRANNGNYIAIKGARENNLKNINVEIPLGVLVCITGVSGSGKSTLIYEVLYKKLAQTLYMAKDKPGDHDAILGLEHIDKMVSIDQSPIGRTPRSNPATYTGAFTPIRELFATLPESKARGYRPGRFSFNVRGGRCEACAGEGYIQIEMQFLPNVTVPCEVCHGQRYNREALEITFKKKTIADVLNMTVEAALEQFPHLPKISSKLQTLKDVGLGYIRLGQPATTLSGGEAQRVKLSTELSRRSTGNTLYLLDEPTTGLSFKDCAALLQVLHRLVDAGNTVVIIEHHLDMIKNADWIIDLGPGPGDKGGQVITASTPEEAIHAKGSLTGKYLEKVL